MSCASEDNAVQQQNERSQQQQQQQKRWQQQQPENGSAGERKQLIVHTMAAASKPQFSHSVPLNVKTLTATVAMVVDDATSPHIYNNIMHNENANDNGNNYSNFNSNSNCNCNSSGSIVGGGMGGHTNALQRIVLKQKHHQQHCQTAQKLYAKAIYDNLADAPDELAFKKGDILTVIEQDTDGIQGWWLCTLRGRQGLCPGNRLRIVNSYDSGCFSPSPPSSPCPSLAASTATLNSSICSADIYENASIISNVSNCNNSGTNNCHQSQWHAQQQQNQHNQRQGTRRSWHVSPNKVITPQRHGDVYIYNCPPSAASYHLQHSQRQSLQHLYQTPQQQQQQQQQQQIYSNQSIYQNRSVMANNTNGGATGGNDFETYDIPKPVTPINYDCPKNVVCRTPTSTMNNQFRMDSISLTMKSNNGVCSTPIQEESYDIPRPLNSLLQQQNTMTPSSSNSSLLTSDSLSLSFSSSNRSSLANMPDYDVPRRNPLPVRGNGIQQLNQSHQQLFQQQQRHSQQHSANANCMTYDFPIPSCSSSTQSTPLQENSPQLLLVASTTKELPLELSSALETLAKLQMESTTAITKLLSFVSPDWRVREKLEPVILDVKLAAVRLRTALHDLTEFGEGALGNATRSEDRTLALKLRPLVRALRDADKLIHESSEAVDAQGGWTVDRLARNDDKALRKPPDSLDQLIACVQTLIEDVRQTTSFIQGNASLLFKRSSSSSTTSSSSSSSTDDATATPSTAIQTSTTELTRLDSSSETSSNINTNGNTINSTSSEWLEDYDYVSFESKDAAAKKNSVLREAIQSNLKKKFDTVLKAAETTAVATAAGSTGTSNKSLLMGGSSNSSNSSSSSSKKDELTDKDKLIVRYYAVQISTHMGNLRQAIDSFLETVEKNQPPKFFIAYGKFVVVSAHNLVMIGDIVHRNVSKMDLREKILACTNSLSDALKTCVTKSKKASAHFPSVTAVQEMVDSVVDISHLASDLKTSMLHAVQSSVI